MGASSGAPTLDDLAGQIRDEIAAAEDGHRTALEHAIRAGELLTQAKAQMTHGEWLPWLRKNFDADRRTATNYMTLVANEKHVSHLSSVREALAEVTRINRENKPPKDDDVPRQQSYNNKHWENDDVIAWAARRMKAGRTRDQLVAESKAGEHDWPLPGRWLGQNAADITRSIVLDRVRRGDTNRRRQPKESGKRLRQLHADKREGRPTGELWNLQVTLAEAAGRLEAFELPALDWTEETEALVNDLYEDLERHARWNDAALDAVIAHIGDLGRKRKINQLRKRADDPSSTPSERASAARLAEKLERKQAAVRLDG